MDRLTVGERIRLHLSTFSQRREAFVCPPEVSQRGIADAAGVSRAHAALELKKLRESGDVDERVAHVEGAATRRKVYFLSPRGERETRAVVDHAAGRRVRLRDIRGEEEVSGDDAVRALVRTPGWTRSQALMAVLTQDVIEVPRGTPSPAVRAPEPFFGRQEELERLRAWAEEDDPPLLVITGVLGVGKTTLLKRFASERPGPVHYLAAREWDTIASLAKTLGASLAAVGSTRLQELAARAPSAGEVAALLTRVAGDHLVILDDCTASKEAELLAKAILATGGPRVLTAATARPSFYGPAALVLEKTVMEMDLAGLDEAATGALCQHLGLPLSPDVAFALTAGHPLSLEFMAASGSEEGIDELSRFVQDQLVAGLDAREREVLKRASVHRKPFPASALGPRGADVLDALVTKGVARREGGGFAVSPVVAAPLRVLLSNEERRAYHSAAADACLETGDELERLHHLAAAGRTMEVAMRLHRVGEEIVQKGGAAELCRILTGLDPGPRYRARWSLESGRALDDLGRWEEAEEALLEAERQGEPDILEEAALLRGRILSKTGRLQAAREVFEGLRGAQTPRRRADGLRGLGVVLRKMGEAADAENALKEAAEAYDAEGAARDRALALMELGNVALGRGDGEAAQDRLTDALEILEGDPLEEPRVRVNLAVAARSMGDLEASLENLELAADLAGDVGQLRTGAYALANAADVLLAMGEADRAEDACLEGEAWAAAIRDPLVQSLLKANRGAVAAHRGDAQTTRAHFEESLRLMEDVDAPDSLAARVEAYAQALEGLGEVQEAAALRKRHATLQRRPNGEKNRQNGGPGQFTP